MNAGLNSLELNVPSSLQVVREVADVVAENGARGDADMEEEKEAAVTPTKKNVMAMRRRRDKSPTKEGSGKKKK